MRDSRGVPTFRAVTTLDLAAMLQRHGGDATRLVQILHEVTAALGYVPPATITELAARLGVSRAHVEGVVGFYSFFSAEPQGRFRVRFSDNITDQMAGRLGVVWLPAGLPSSDEVAIIAGSVPR